MKMKNPQDISLPFFAYGIFKPGQLAFFQIREFVCDKKPIKVKGGLLIRDGLPIINLKGYGFVNGALIFFEKGKEEDAYGCISAMEPDKHYKWSTLTVNNEIDNDNKPQTANVLAGIKPLKGSIYYEGDNWDGWEDPLFNEALEVVEDESKQGCEWDLKYMFKLQMAYLLLWSSIERYVSLCYHFGDKATMKIQQLAREKIFALSLKEIVKKKRYLYRADKPGEKLTLDPKDPKKSVPYYYQIRSNIIHRGKGGLDNLALIKKSLQELLQIFRNVLEAAKDDAEKIT